MDEHWKDIQDYEGLYQVSDMGRVRNIRTGRILRPDKGGRKGAYFRMKLHKNGNVERPYAHRLVAQAFIPNPDNLPEVNHIDEDGHNNHVGNLEWCTEKRNCNHGTRNQRIGKANGKTVAQYTTDGELAKIWVSATEVERETGIRHQGISMCCNGKLKKYKGFMWTYQIPSDVPLCSAP